MTPLPRKPGRPRTSAIAELRRRSREVRLAAAERGLMVAGDALRLRQASPTGLGHPIPRADWPDLDAAKRFLVALIREANLAHKRRV